MKTTLSSRLLPLAAAASLLTGGGAAFAQSQTTSPYGSMMGLTGSYVGINLGQPEYSTPCGAGGLFSCEDPDLAVKVTAGGMFHRFFGAEVGYIHFGDADRAGGETRAHGLNLSLVGRVPLGPIGIFGKVGTTYSRTETSANILTAAPVGDASGWGRSYGGGVSWDFHPNWTLVGEWERHRVHFASGADDVDNTSVGVQYRF